MTNTHRKTTTSTTAKIAAVGAFGIGAAIAFPGLAAAEETPAPDTSSLAGVTAEDGSLSDMTGDEGSLQGALGTDIGLDLGSLALNVNLDAETPTPGSVDFGSVGVSPNTGSDAVDGGSGESGDSATGSLASGSTGSADDETEAEPASGSLASSEDDTTAGDDTTADSGSVASSEDDPATGDDATETGSLSGALAGLSSGAADEGTEAPAEDAAATTGSMA